MSVFSFRRKAVLNIEVLFHTETNDWGHHGIILASNRSLGLELQRIRFAFKHSSQAPALRPDILAFIFDKAREKGFTPFELLSYNYVLSESARVSHSPRLPGIQ